MSLFLSLLVVLALLCTYRLYANDERPLIYLQPLLGPIENPYAHPHLEPLSRFDGRYYIPGVGTFDDEMLAKAALMSGAYDKFLRAWAQTEDQIIFDDLLDLPAITSNNPA